MKARMIKADERDLDLTLGKVYKGELDHNGNFDILKDDIGEANSLLKGQFELVKDEPKKGNDMKVGDKVRCINGGESPTGLGWEDGLEFTISKIVNYTSYGSVYFGGKNGDGVRECHLELVKPKKDPIVKSVLKKYKQRSKVGIEKYGCTLERTDLTDEEWFEHLQFELMDATLYIERILKALHERK
jgi:hypothetical protein